MRQILFIYLFLAPLPILAQVEEPVQDSVDYEFYIIEGDTIARSHIDLDEVLILGRLKFDSDLERRKYLILRRKTIKVYPYAKLASERLVELNNRLDQIKSKRDRKRYTKIVQDYIENQFSAELKKLTRTEGQILVKLIHRQTGITAFDLVKDLKSGWRAFWYNTTASFFDISLKEEFDPSKNEEDYYIEDILQRAFQGKQLERQPSALDYNFLELTDKWSAPVKGDRKS
ncbi:DUF4294 domain-containing protein [Salinimicrobium terrae]|uniref:DUF4294 domain-containing protein n=1 Tax=Salinimicrobium terrae TaxID=470866 RepID=UPI000417B75C|nr:DUF4294 domain-containing protein [Salinimicrobium terrae]